MSTGMRWTASADASATATMAMTTVNGRLSARRTKRIVLSISESWRDARNKRLDISGRGSHRKHRAPNTEPCKGIVNFRLCQQALGIGNFNDRAQARLIASAGLLIGCGGSTHRDGRIR